jgi:hypothetical protein
VRHVEGLGAGIYRYVPASHALRRTKEGDYSATCESASLQQEFCGTADVVFVKTVAWRDLLVPDGDRGYRYACLRAGVAGEGLYLAGSALGIGVCGVGAFEDPSSHTANPYTRASDNARARIQGRPLHDRPRRLQSMSGLHGGLHLFAGIAGPGVRAGAPSGGELLLGCWRRGSACYLNFGSVS